MIQPEESQEKTSKVDDVLLKPVLKDLDELREGEDLDDEKTPPRESEGFDKES